MLPPLASEDLTRIPDQVVTTHRSQPHTIQLLIANEPDSQFSLYLTNLANLDPEPETEPATSNLGIAS